MHSGMPSMQFVYMELGRADFAAQVALVALCAAGRFAAWIWFMLMWPQLCWLQKFTHGLASYCLQRTFRLAAEILVNQEISWPDDSPYSSLFLKYHWSHPCPDHSIQLLVALATQIHIFGLFVSGSYIPQTVHISFIQPPYHQGLVLCPHRTPRGVSGAPVEISKCGTSCLHAR